MSLEPKLDELHTLVAETAVDSVVVTSTPNTGYYLGHSRYGRGRSALVADEDSVVCFVPAGEEGFVPEVSASIETYPSYRIDTLEDSLIALAERINEHIYGTVGIEGGDAQPTGIETEGIPHRLLAALDTDGTRNITGEILGQRRYKDESDLEAIREAMALTSLGLQTVREAIEPGISEIDLHGAAFSAMETEAGRPLDDFSADLVSGEKTASIGYPAAIPGNRALTEGDFVLVELLPRINHYKGSSARTFTVGDPTDRQQELHNVVLEALNDAKEFIEPGVAAADVYETVVDSLAEAGYDENFPHHAGHGVGMTVHEPPMLIPGSEQTVQEGDVLAIEPGIYDEEWGGLRIEDVVYVTDDGVETITDVDYGL